VINRSFTANLAQKNDPQDFFSMEHPSPLDSSMIMRGHFDEVCQRIRHAMDPISTHAVSLYDEDGGLLWMTSSILNDDLAARAAFKSFSSAGAPIVVLSLGHERGRPQSDAQSAVVFRVTDEGGHQVGAAMVIINTAMIPQERVLGTQLLTEPLRRVLSEFAMLRSGASATNSDAVAATSRKSEPVKLVSMPTKATPAMTSAPKVERADPTDLKAPARATLRPAMVERASPKDSIATAAAAPAKARTPPPSAIPRAAPDPLLEALRQSSVALHVQRFIPLEEGVRLQRYEVFWEFSPAEASSISPKELQKLLLDQKPSSLIDRRVFGELIEWMKSHPEVWQERVTRLSIKLSKSALNDPDFVPFVRRVLQMSGLPKEMIGFEIPAATPRKYVAAVSELGKSLQQSGCFLVLDNFSLRTESFAALHLPGVQLIKLSHDMTVKMQTDKITRAAISAMTQMARVLGIQTVAKRTKLAEDLLRLTSYGVDFVQSESIAPAMPIAGLIKLTSPHG
jgi:EAL domain-containing protein (putative c-di-GMP-specific phosphodiesterase class I)